MAVDVGAKIEVTLKTRMDSSMFMTVYGYEVGGTFTALPAAEVAAAWWNAVKGNYRAMVRASAGFYYSSVVVRDAEDLEGDLAEWAIPSGEQQGTRSGVSEDEFLPPFNAAAVRLSVGTRVTRPGQKRIPGLLEVDNGAGLLQPAYNALLVTLFNQLTDNITLPSPALGMELIPLIFGKDVTGAVVRSQPVVGYVISPNISSQVSRKIGRGV